MKYFISYVIFFVFTVQTVAHGQIRQAVKLWKAIFEDDKRIVTVVHTTEKDKNVKFHYPDANDYLKAKNYLKNFNTYTNNVGQLSKAERLASNIESESFLEGTIALELSTALPFEKPKQKIDTFISIPTTDQEYENIFKSFGKKQFSEIKTIKNNFSQNSNTYFLKSAISFKKRLSTKTKIDLPIVIIGHNSNGILYFPDGSNLTLNEIDKVAKQNDKVIIYLSCNAKEYTSNPAPRFALTYNNAYELNKRINLFLGYYPDMDSQDLGTRIQAIIDVYGSRESDKYNQSVMVFTFGGAGAAGLYYVVTTNKN